MDKRYDDVVLHAKLTELGNSQQGTFEDFGHTYKDGTKSCLKLVDTIVEVFDQYYNNESVKAQKHPRRQVEQAGRQYQVIRGCVISPWKTFTVNKAVLKNYLSVYMEEVLP